MKNIILLITALMILSLTHAVTQFQCNDYSSYGAQAYQDDCKPGDLLNNPRMVVVCVPPLSVPADTDVCKSADHETTLYKAGLCSLPENFKLGNTSGPVCYTSHDSTGICPQYPNQYYISPGVRVAKYKGSTTSIRLDLSSSWNTYFHFCGCDNWSGDSCTDGDGWVKKHNTIEQDVKQNHYVYVVYRTVSGLCRLDVGARQSWLHGNAWFRYYMTFPQQDYVINTLGVDMRGISNWVSPNPASNYNELYKVTRTSTASTTYNYNLITGALTQGDNLNWYLAVKDAGGISSNGLCFKPQCSGVGGWTATNSVRTTICGDSVIRYDPTATGAQRFKYYCETGSGLSIECRYGIECGSNGWSSPQKELIKNYGLALEDGQVCRHSPTCTKNGYVWGAQTTNLILLNPDGSVSSPGDFECGVTTDVNNNLISCPAFFLEDEEYCVTKIDCINCDNKYSSVRLGDISSYDKFRHCDWLSSKGVTNYQGWAGVKTYCPTPGTVVAMSNYQVCYYNPSGARCDNNGCNVKSAFMYGGNYYCDPASGPSFKIPCPTCSIDLNIQDMPSKINFAMQNITRLTPPNKPTVTSCSCNALVEAREVATASNCPSNKDVLPRGAWPNNWINCTCQQPNVTLFQGMNWSLSNPYGFNVYNSVYRYDDRCYRLGFAGDNCYWGRAFPNVASMTLTSNHGAGLIASDVWCGGNEGDNYNVVTRGSMCNYTANRISYFKYNISTLLDLTIYAFNKAKSVPVYVVSFNSGGGFKSDDGLAETNHLLDTNGISFKLAITENLTFNEYQNFSVSVHCSALSDNSILQVSISGPGISEHVIGGVACNKKPDWGTVSYNPSDYNHDIAYGEYTLKLAPLTGSIYLSFDVNNEQSSDYPYTWGATTSACSIGSLTPSSQTLVSGVTSFKFLSPTSRNDSLYYVKGDGIYSLAGTKLISTNEVWDFNDAGDRIIIRNSSGLYLYNPNGVAIGALGSTALTNYSMIAGGRLANGFNEFIILGNASGVTLFPFNNVETGIANPFIMPTDNEVTALRVGRGGQALESLFYSVKGEGVYNLIPAQDDLGFKFAPLLLRGSNLAIYNFAPFDYDDDGDYDLLGMTGPGELGVYTRFRNEFVRKSLLVTPETLFYSFNYVENPLRDSSSDASSNSGEIQTPSQLSDVIIYENCVKGYCLSLNGTSYVKASNGSKVDVGVDSFIMHFYLKITGDNDNSYVAIKGRVNSAGELTSPGYGIKLDGNTLGFLLRDSSTLIQASNPATKPVSINEWHYVVLMVDRINSISSLHINNEVVADADIAGLGSLDNDYPFTIGAAQDESNNYVRKLTGVIDEFVIIKGGVFGNIAGGDFNNNGVPDFIFMNSTDKLYLAEEYLGVLQVSEFSFTGSMRSVQANGTGFNQKLFYQDGGSIKHLSDFTYEIICPSPQLEPVKGSPLVRIDYSKLVPTVILDQLFPNLRATDAGDIKLNKSYGEIHSQAVTDFSRLPTLFCGDNYWLNLSIKQDEPQFEFYDYFNFTIKLDGMPIYCTNSTGRVNHPLSSYDTKGIFINKSEVFTVETQCHMLDCNHGPPQTYELELCTQAGELEYENCYTFKTGVQIAGYPRFSINKQGSPINKYRFTACGQDSSFMPTGTFNIYASNHTNYVPKELEGLYNHITRFEVINEGVTPPTVICSSINPPSFNKPLETLASNCELSGVTNYKLVFYIFDYFKFEIPKALIYWEYSNQCGARCNNDFYNTATQGCCGTTVYDKATQGCCGGTVYDTATQGCCGTTVYDKATQGCCGATVYDTATHLCCNDVIGSKADGNACCLQAVYDTATQGCCGTIIYTTATQVCCANTIYTKTAGVCCTNVWYSGSSRCCSNTDCSSGQNCILYYCV